MPRAIVSPAIPRSGPAPPHNPFLDLNNTLCKVVKDWAPSTAFEQDKTKGMISVKNGHSGVIIAQNMADDNGQKISYVKLVITGSNRTGWVRAECIKRDPPQDPIRRPVRFIDNLKNPTKTQQDNGFLVLSGDEGIVLRVDGKGGYQVRLTRTRKGKVGAIDWVPVQSVQKGTGIAGMPGVRFNGIPRIGINVQGHAAPGNSVLERTIRELVLAMKQKQQDLGFLTDRVLSILNDDTKLNTFVSDMCTGMQDAGVWGVLQHGSGCSPQQLMNSARAITDKDKGQGIYLRIYLSTLLLIYAGQTGGFGKRMDEHDGDINNNRPGHHFDTVRGINTATQVSKIKFCVFDRSIAKGAFDLAETITFLLFGCYSEDLMGPAASGVAFDPMASEEVKARAIHQMVGSRRHAYTLTSLAESVFQKTGWVPVIKTQPFRNYGGLNWTTPVAGYDAYETTLWTLLEDDTMETYHKSPVRVVLGGGGSTLYVSILYKERYMGTPNQERYYFQVGFTGDKDLERAGFKEGVY